MTRKKVLFEINGTLFKINISPFTIKAEHGSQENSRHCARKERLPRFSCFFVFI